jgi:hypothetical protein
MEGQYCRLLFACQSKAEVADTHEKKTIPLAEPRDRASLRQSRASVRLYDTERWCGQVYTKITAFRGETEIIPVRAPLGSLASASRGQHADQLVPARAPEQSGRTSR